MVRTVPPLSARVRVRVSVSFSYGVTLLRILFCMCPPIVCLPSDYLSKAEAIFTAIVAVKIASQLFLRRFLRRCTNSKEGGVTAKGTGPHRVTGPESTAWLLPLMGTVGRDVSANNRASNVIAWPCEMYGVHGRELGELNV